MSPTTSDKLTTKTAATNQKVASSIVHKPFDTGKINIFHPHKGKPNGKMIPAKLMQNATLEESDSLERLLPTSQLPSWLSLFLNPWSIGAIAILLLANIASGILIWQNSTSVVSSNDLKEEQISVGDYDLAAQEFVPLNLNTLSTLPSSLTNNNPPESTKLQVEIPPALLPLDVNNLNSLNPQYHYILTEYQGDRSLELARQQVDNISLVHFPQGIFIYLGAFTEKTAATNFISQLQATGIKAYIYPFQN